ncbi:MAG: TIGR04282 family arsenosugar biosynthesis glycosyltransferase [Acidimicrobiales bacterium]
MGGQIRSAGLLVMAKEPLAGRVKTRLCPPCSPDQAAAIAAASLTDTLETVAATPSSWAAVALDGQPGSWLRKGVGVFAQREGGFDQRLAQANADADARFGPPAAMVIIGADTPQVSVQGLTEAMDRLLQPGVDAVIGLALDGGYWAIGLRRPCSRAFLGVPMSTARTGSAQHQRLRDLGLKVEVLPSLRDVDAVADAVAVAAMVPGSGFDRAVVAAGLKPDPPKRAPAVTA